MERELTGLYRVVNGLAKALGGFDGLIEYVVFAGVARAVFEMSLYVRLWYELHTGVVGIRRVDGQPTGDGFGGCKRPVRCVLMPRNGLAIAGHFAEKMGSPANDIVTNNIAHVAQYALVAGNVVDARVFDVTGND